TLTLNGNAIATVNGNNDTINEVNGATVTSTGSGHVLNVSGTGNQATLAGGTVNVAANAAVTLTGNNVVIAEDGGGSVITSGSGTSLDVRGTGNAAAMSNGSIVIEAGTSSAQTVLTLNGANNNLTVVEKGYGTLTANGGGTGNSVDIRGVGNVANVFGVA